MIDKWSATLTLFSLSCKNPGRIPQCDSSAPDKHLRIYTHQVSVSVDSQGIAVFSKFLSLVVLVYEVHVLLKHSASAYNISTELYILLFFTLGRYIPEGV